MEKQHFFRWTHLTDGYFLKEDWTVALLNRHQHKIPVMVGHALHDFPTVSRAKTLAEFEAEARATYEDRAGEYLDIVDFKRGDLEQIKKNATYSLQCIGTLDWCEHSVRCGGFPPMYAYNFDQPVPGDPNGPSHGAEVPFAFGNLYYTRKPYRGVHYDLERQLSLYWTNFAKNGNPNGLDEDGSVLPEWSAYSTEKPFEMRFKGGAHMESEQPTLMKFLIDWSLDWHKKNPVK
jgi:para-nitrobenzyl esterase